MSQYTPEQFDQVTQLLGRAPRGLEEIAVSTAEGRPAVIRVASLVEDKPFPTLFWLVDPDLNYRIDQLEAGGLIARMQQQVDADPTLQQSMCADHRAHIELRNSYLSDADRLRLNALGMNKALSERGIGGIASFDRIRCLHTWYAAHLAQANTIGAMIDAYWSAADSEAVGNA